MKNYIMLTRYRKFGTQINIKLDFNPKPKNPKTQFQRKIRNPNDYKNPKKCN